MEKLKGDECPLLFGKWRPVESTILDHDGHINQDHDLGFCLVQIKSSKVGIPEHFVSGSYSFREPNMVSLFKPEMSELYHDAVRGMQERLREDPNPSINQISILDYCFFSRETVLKIAVDDSIPFEKSQERNTTIQGVYQSLEEHLRSHHDVVREELAENRPFGLVSDGNLKLLNFGDGVYVMASSPFEMYSGEITLTVKTYDEEPEKNREQKEGLYGKIVNTLVEGISTNQEILRTYHGKPYLDVGSGAFWRIDLSNAEIPALTGLIEPYLRLTA